MLVFNAVDQSSVNSDLIVNLLLLFFKIALYFCNFALELICLVLLAFEMLTMVFAHPKLSPCVIVN